MQIKNEKLYISLEKKYLKIQKEMVGSNESFFNSTTIEALMEALYELNKKAPFEGRKNVTNGY